MNTLGHIDRLLKKKMNYEKNMHLNNYSMFV